MYRTKPQMQAQKDLRRESLLRAAEALFTERGYAGTGMKDLVERAGTSIGNCYFYFRDKDALFEALLDSLVGFLDRVEEWALVTSTGPVSCGFCRTKAAELWSFQNRPSLAALLLSSGMGSNLLSVRKRELMISRSNERIARVFGKMSAKGVRASGDPRLDAVFCNGTELALVQEWYACRRDEPLLDGLPRLLAYNLNAFRLPWTESEIAGYSRDAIRDVERQFGAEIGFEAVS